MYTYVDHGGAAQAARELQLPLHRVIKTLVLETDERKRLLMLMHGDQTVSTRNLARVLRVKKMIPADPRNALRCTGYQVGGISPFGTLQRLPVYVQRSILDLKVIYINGGKRGFLVAIDPAVLTRLLDAVPVDAAAAHIR
jgi:Cys-tRNA(Pro) deacylase